MKKILIVDDGPTAEALSDGFQLEGYRVARAADGNEAISKFEAERPDILLLDAILPGIDGLEICRRLRSEGARTPIILLSARDQEIDRVLGLRSGADDYVTKPFSFLELFARAEALLRRSGDRLAREGPTAVGGLVLDPGTMRAVRDGRDLGLTPREFRILLYLVQHRDTVVTREQLLLSVWGVETKTVTRTVDVTIAKLRKKLGASASRQPIIATVHGAGYRFIAQRV